MLNNLNPRLPRLVFGAAKPPPPRIADIEEVGGMSKGGPLVDPEKDFQEKGENDPAGDPGFAGSDSGGFHPNPLRVILIVFNAKFRSIMNDVGELT
jgi:hypothetical protein